MYSLNPRTSYSKKPDTPLNHGHFKQWRVNRNGVQIIGHTKIAKTQIYANVIGRKVSEDMQRLRVFHNVKNKDSKFKWDLLF